MYQAEILSFGTGSFGLLTGDSGLLVAFTILFFASTSLLGVKAEVTGDGAEQARQHSLFWAGLLTFVLTFIAGLTVGAQLQAMIINDTFEADGAQRTLVVAILAVVSLFVLFASIQRSLQENIREFVFQFIKMFALIFIFLTSINLLLYLYDLLFLTTFDAATLGIKDENAGIKMVIVQVLLVGYTIGWYMFHRMDANMNFGALTEQDKKK